LEVDILENSYGTEQIKMTLVFKIVSSSGVPDSSYFSHYPSEETESLKGIPPSQNQKHALQQQSATQSITSLGTPCCIRTEQSHTAMISRILFFLALVVLAAQVRSTRLCLACLRFDI
jgi:hypothetical protein